MLDSVSSIASLATQLSSQKTAQDIDAAVLKKAQDLQVQQGKDAVQLIASAVVSPGKVDVQVWLGVGYGKWGSPNLTPDDGGIHFLIFPKGKPNPQNPLNLIWVLGVLGVLGAWVGGLWFYVPKGIPPYLEG